MSNCTVFSSENMLIKSAQKENLRSLIPNRIAKIPLFRFKQSVSEGEIGDLKLKTKRIVNESKTYCCFSPVFKLVRVDTGSCGQKGVTRGL